MVDGTVSEGAFAGILSGNEKSDRHSSVDSAISPACEFSVEDGKLTEGPSDFF